MNTTRLLLNNPQGLSVLQPIPGGLQAEAGSLPSSQWTESQPGQPQVHSESEGSSSAPTVGEAAEGADRGLQVGAGDPGWGWASDELGEARKRNWKLRVAPDGPPTPKETPLQLPPPASAYTKLLFPAHVEQP